MIICTGEALIDFVPDESRGPESLPGFQPVAGGSPYNCAIAASRLGSDVAFAGAISTDFFGDHLVQRLGDDSVRLDFVTRIDRPSTLAFVSRSDSGSASYAFFTNDVADRSFTAGMVPELGPGNILQFGSISLLGNPSGEEILKLVSREGSRQVVAFDPNIRTSLIVDETEYRERLSVGLSHTAILKSSDEDLNWIYPRDELDTAVRRAMDMGAKIVIVTKGALGATAYTASEQIHVPTRAAAIVDTIGAGDSFLAAILVWLDEHGVAGISDVEALSARDLQHALTFAADVAAVTCSRTGADPPRRSELG